MKKILTVLTGGTIGCESQNGILSVQSGNCRALELYKETYHDDTEFVIVQPLHILSENLDKKHWETLVNFLYSTDLTDFDGIIITHGSDTLSYTSAVLGICCRHFNIPVVITAANYIPDDSRSNALCNIHAAVVLVHTFSHGVFTVYRNDGENFCSVYLPEQIREADRFLGKFTSFRGSLFGKITENGFHQLTPSLYPVRMSPAFSDKTLSLANDILLIKPYPSMLYSAIALPDTVKAVLHITYHSCTVKTDGTENALYFLKKCQNKGIDFYFTAVKGSSVYETSHALLQNGAVPLWNLSDEAALAKLLLYYNCQIQDRSVFLSDSTSKNPT